MGFTTFSELTVPRLTLNFFAPLTPALFGAMLARLRSQYRTPRRRLSLRDGCSTV
jgi:hypothetical protein